MDITIQAKQVKVLSLSDFIGIYITIINNANINSAKKLRIVDIEKH